jgi:hypothetical protein
MLTAVLLALSTPLLAQAPQGEGAPPQGKSERPFDCSRAKDPQGCEARVAKLREAREKARATCQGKSGEDRRACMRKSVCAETKDPGRCEERLKAREDRRQQMREQRSGGASKS